MQAEVTTTVQSLAQQGQTRLLENKTAVIFAAGGAIGSAVAQAFSREGALVFASGRHLESVERVAAEIQAVDGRVESAEIDALSEPSLEAYFEHILEQTGQIDIVFNAIGILPTEGAYGIPATAIPYDKFLLPITTHVGAQFLTARVAARHMSQQQSGAILTLSASIGAEARAFMAGVSAACAAVEGMTRSLAAELAPAGIRVNCLRPGALLETRTIQETMHANAQTIGMPLETYSNLIREASLMRRTATVAEAAEMAIFLVSERASAVTGQVVNVNCGTVLH